MGGEVEIVVSGGELLLRLEEEVDRDLRQVGRGPAGHHREEDASGVTVRIIWRGIVVVLGLIVQQDAPYVRSRGFCNSTLKLFVLEELMLFIKGQRAEVILLLLRKNMALEQKGKEFHQKLSNCQKTRGGPFND